ncbi:unnamed protein product, partial [Pylaiella littoralis]
REFTNVLKVLSTEPVLEGHLDNIATLFFEVWVFSTTMSNREYVYFGVGDGTGTFEKVMATARTANLNAAMALTRYIREEILGARGESAVVPSQSLSSLRPSSSSSSRIDSELSSLDDMVAMLCAVLEDRVSKLKGLEGVTAGAG